MAGDPLRHFQRSAVLQKFVIRVALKEWGENASDKPAALSILAAIGLPGGYRAYASCLPRSERGCGWPISKTRYLQILVKKLLQSVLHGDLRLLTASFPRPSRPTEAEMRAYMSLFLEHSRKLVASVELDLVAIALPRRLQTP